MSDSHSLVFFFKFNCRFSALKIKPFPFGVPVPKSFSSEQPGKYNFINESQ